MGNLNEVHTVERKSADVPPFPAKALANAMLDWSARKGQAVTPLKIQKLLYFVHCDYLSVTGKPLVKEEFEAWSYGPVIPSVYEEFKKFGKNNISAKAKSFNPVTRDRVEVEVKISPEDELLVYNIFEIYADVGAVVLSDLSHAIDGPWDQALRKFRASENINRIISNDLILLFHNRSRV